MFQDSTKVYKLMWKIKGLQFGFYVAKAQKEWRAKENRQTKFQRSRIKRRVL